MIEDYDAKFKMIRYKVLSYEKSKTLNEWYNDEAKFGRTTVATISQKSKLEIIEKLNSDLDEDDFDLSSMNMNRLNRFIKTVRLKVITKADKSGKNIRKHVQKYHYSNQQMAVMNCCGVLELVDPDGRKYLNQYYWLLELMNQIKLDNQPLKTQIQFQDLNHDVKRKKRKDWKYGYGSLTSPAKSDDFDQQKLNSNQIVLPSNSNYSTKKMISIEEKDFDDNLNRINYTLISSNKIKTTKKILFTIYKQKRTTESNNQVREQISQQSQNHMNVGKEDNDCIMIDSDDNCIILE